MGAIQKMIAKHKEKVKARNDMCDNLIVQIDIALQEITILFSDLQSFVEPNEESKWHNRNDSLMTNFYVTNVKKLKRAIHYKKLLEKKMELFHSSNSLKQQISIYNNRVAEAKIENAYNLIGNVEGRRLDKQQMTCIVKDVHNHLVIAGAGTGKTTTVVG